MELNIGNTSIFVEPYNMFAFYTQDGDGTIKGWQIKPHVYFTDDVWVSDETTPYIVDTNNFDNDEWHYSLLDTSVLPIFNRDPEKDPLVIRPTINITALEKSLTGSTITSATTNGNQITLVLDGIVEFVFDYTAVGLSIIKPYTEIKLTKVP